MNKLNGRPFGVLLIFALLVGGFLLGQSRPVPQKVAYVDSQRIVEAHPDFKNVAAVRDQAQKELKPLQDRLAPIQAKIQAGTATAKEQQDFQILRQSYQDAAKRWNTRVQETLAPITNSINKTIAQIAEAQGFAMVMDGEIAGPQQSGLVVFFDKELDLTDAVIKALPK